MNPDPELTRLLRAYGASNCRCPVIVDCGHEGKCDCLVLLTPPCEHLLALWAKTPRGIDFQECYEMHFANFFEERRTNGIIEIVSDYDNPIETPAPSIALSREARTELRSERYGPVELGEGPGEQSLWNDDDLVPEDDDYQEREISTGANGREYLVGLRTAGRGSKLPTKEQKALADFGTRRLQLVKSIIARMNGCKS